MVDIELIKAIGNFGMGVVCLATLIVLHVYNVKVTMPALAKDAREQIDKLVLAFRQELEHERQQCHEDHEKLFAGIQANTKAIVDNQTALVRLIDRYDRPGSPQTR